MSILLRYSYSDGDDYSYPEDLLSSSTETYVTAEVYDIKDEKHII